MVKVKYPSWYTSNPRAAALEIEAAENNLKCGAEGMGALRQRNGGDVKNAETFFYFSNLYPFSVKQQLLIISHDIILAI